MPSFSVRLFDKEKQLTHNVAGKGKLKLILSNVTENVAFEWVTFVCYSD